MDYKYNDFKHGQKCTCTINGSTITDAKISIGESGRVFICQNDESGASADNRFDYEYSWLLLSKGDNFDDSHNSVEDLVLNGKKGKPEMVKFVVLYDNYDEDPAVKFYNRSDMNKWFIKAIDDRQIKFSSIEVFEVKKEQKVRTSFRLS